jgi:hypothetical protein
MIVERGWQRECPQRGRPGTMVLEEPEYDSTGTRSVWAAATGCWQVLEGKLTHNCRGRFRQHEVECLLSAAVSCCGCREGVL